MMDNRRAPYSRMDTNAELLARVTKVAGHNVAANADTIKDTDDAAERYGLVRRIIWVYPPEPLTTTSR